MYPVFRAPKDTSGRLNGSNLTNLKHDKLSKQFSTGDTQLLSTVFTKFAVKFSIENNLKSSYDV